MSQTTLSILALAIAMLISVAQIRWTVQTQYRLVDDELEVMASGVARQVLEYAESRSFDERTTPAQWTALGEPLSNAEFDTTGAFGNSPACSFSDLTLNTTGCDDIDDLHMGARTWQEVPFIMGTDTMKFEVHVSVQYVKDLDPEVPLTGTARSESKEVIVKVRSPLHVQQSRFTEGLVQLRRLLVYNAEVEELRATVYAGGGTP